MAVCPSGLGSRLQSGIRRFDSVYGLCLVHGPVAQWTELLPPKKKAEVRVLLGPPLMLTLWVVSQRESRGARP